MTKSQFNRITKWQQKTFPNATPMSKLNHLAEELIELADAIKKGEQTRDLEYADCFFLLFGAAAADGMTYSHICEVIEAKFTINKDRQWGTPDENGVVKHIERVK